MAGFHAARERLEDLSVSVVAASVDEPERAAEVAREVYFPVASGVSRELANRIGAWWNEDRSFVQPAEFLMRGDGTIVNSTYSAGPLGRLDAADVISLVEFLAKR